MIIHVLDQQSRAAFHPEIVRQLRSHRVHIRAYIEALRDQLSRKPVTAGGRSQKAFCPGLAGGADGGSGTLKCCDQACC